MTPYEIPLTPDPQTFAITLSGVVYRMGVYWADAPGGGWFLNIGDQNGVPLIMGIPLVTGVDLLAQYEYVGIPGALVVQSDYDADALPTFENLGVTSHLFYVT